MNDIDVILKEANVNYNPQKNAKMDDLKSLIDAYYEADKKEKDAKKEKMAIRSNIDVALDGMEIGGCLVLEGNEHKIQVVEKHSYSLDNEKCDSDSGFAAAYNRGKLPGVEKNITLKIVPAELQAVVDALRAAGLNQVVEDIKHEWVFNGKAEDVRKLMESTEEINVRDFVNDTVTIQVSAKK